MRSWLRSAYWALVLIGAGVFLLVRNTTTAGRLEHVRLWPLLLIALGLWVLLERVGRWWGKAGGLFVPLLLIGIGVVLVLRDAAVITSKVSLWPVVLIALGLAILGAAVPWGRRPSLKRSEERIGLEGRPGPGPSSSTEAAGWSCARPRPRATCWRGPSWARRTSPCAAKATMSKRASGPSAGGRGRGDRAPRGRSDCLGTFRWRWSSGSAPRRSTST